MSARAEVLVAHSYFLLDDAKQTEKMRPYPPLATMITAAEAVFAAEEHIAVEVTWWVYQQIINAYAHPDPRQGKRLLTGVIDMIRTGLPAGLEELATLGRTLHRRRDDVLAYFCHRASNGPTESVNGRLGSRQSPSAGTRPPVPACPSSVRISGPAKLVRSSVEPLKGDCDWL